MAELRTRVGLRRCRCPDADARVAIAPSSAGLLRPSTGPSFLRVLPVRLLESPTANGVQSKDTISPASRAHRSGAVQGAVSGAAARADSHTSIAFFRAGPPP